MVLVTTGNDFVFDGELAPVVIFPVENTSKPDSISVDDWVSFDSTVEVVREPDLAIRNIISLADSMLQVVFASGQFCSSSSVIVNTIRTICSTAISLQSAILMAKADAQEFVLPVDLEHRVLTQFKSFC